jgi:hypothetical protein
VPPGGTDDAAPPERLPPAARAAFRAALRLGSRARPRAGGVELRAGPVPLALDEAVWCPDPARLEELTDGAGAPDAIVPAGDPAEAALRAAGFAPSLGIATDDPGRDRPAAFGADGGEVGWHAAPEVASVLTADLDAPELRDALATVLASAASADAGVRLLRAGPGGPPPGAAVVVEVDGAVVVVLTGGDADGLATRALAEGRALGKRAVWTRLRPADADDAHLRRWEVAG